MPVIVDASLLVAVSTRDARSDRVGAWFLHWLDTGTELNAPELALYEVASGITRLAAAGLFPIHRIAEIWSIWETCHSPFTPSPAVRGS